MNTYYIGGMPVTDELYHHGILGQKWGVRRYQNPDGTLTPAGKKRYYGVGEGIDTGDSGKQDNTGYKVTGSKSSRFGFSSTIPRGELTEKGKQKYGDDPSLMPKGKFKRQVLRNQAWGDNSETKRIDREMNKYFKETKNAYNGKNYLKTYKKIDQYVTDMARARLKDMGYTPNDKAVEYLRNQPWFFNSVPLSYMLPPEKQPH
jgi:hypothetical protein